MLLTGPERPCTGVSVLSNFHTLPPGLQETAGAAVSLQSDQCSAAAESTAEVNIEHLVLPLSLYFTLSCNNTFSQEGIDKVEPCQYKLSI